MMENRKVLDEILNAFAEKGGRKKKKGKRGGPYQIRGEGKG